MRLVVFSDLHLEAPFAWARPEAARALRQSLRQALADIVTLAKARGAEAILCAGDLYEHDRATAETAEFLRQRFAEAAPCRVFLAPGNHDPLVAGSIYAEARFSSNVHVFSEPRFESIQLADGVTLWGAAHLQPRGTPGFFEEGAFRATGPGIQLGLFHGSERSFLAFEGGAKLGHAPFRASEVAAAGFSHAFVGHYHNTRLEPAFTYPGAPAFLSFGAPVGGAVVAELLPASKGAPAIARELVSVAPIESHDLSVDVTGVATVGEIRARVADALAERRGVARVSLTGALPAGLELLAAEDLSREALGDTARGLVDLQVRADALTPAYDIDAIAGERSVRGEFVRRVRAADLEEPTRSQVITAGLRALDGREDLEVVP